MSDLALGSVVWVRLGQAWWPGTLTSLDRCPPEFLQGLHKEPIAVVKFFHENEFHDIHKREHVLPYSCTRKMEFIKKGQMINKNQSHGDVNLLQKFESDVITAERLTGGDMNILETLEDISESPPNPRSTGYQYQQSAYAHGLQRPQMLGSPHNNSNQQVVMSNVEGNDDSDCYIEEDYEAANQAAQKERQNVGEHRRIIEVGDHRRIVESNPPGILLSDMHARQPGTHPQFSNISGQGTYSLDQTGQRDQGQAASSSLHSKSKPCISYSSSPHYTIEDTDYSHSKNTHLYKPFTTVPRTAEMLDIARRTSDVVERRVIADSPEVVEVDSEPEIIDEEEVEHQNPSPQEQQLEMEEDESRERYQLEEEEEYKEQYQPEEEEEEEEMVAEEEEEEETVPQSHYQEASSEMMGEEEAEEEEEEEYAEEEEEEQETLPQQHSPSEVVEEEIVPQTLENGGFSLPRVSNYQKKNLASHSVEDDIEPYEEEAETSENIEPQYEQGHMDDDDDDYVPQSPGVDDDDAEEIYPQPPEIEEEEEEEQEQEEEYETELPSKSQMEELSSPEAEDYIPESPEQEPLSPVIGSMSPHVFKKKAATNYESTENQDFNKSLSANSEADSGINDDTLATEVPDNQEIYNQNEIPSQSDSEPVVTSSGMDENEAKCIEDGKISAKRKIVGKEASVDENKVSQSRTRVQKADSSVSKNMSPSSILSKDKVTTPRTKRVRISDAGGVESGNKRKREPSPKKTKKLKKEESELDTDDELPDLMAISQTKEKFKPDDLIWVKWRKDWWPSYVKCAYPQARKYSIYFIGWPQTTGIKVSASNIRRLMTGPIPSFVNQNQPGFSDAYQIMKSYQKLQSQGKPTNTHAFFSKKSEQLIAKTPQKSPKTPKATPKTPKATPKTPKATPRTPKSASKSITKSTPKSNSKGTPKSTSKQSQKSTPKSKKLTPKSAKKLKLTPKSSTKTPKNSLKLTPSSSKKGAKSSTSKGTPRSSVKVTPRTPTSKKEKLSEKKSTPASSSFVEVASRKLQLSARDKAKLESALKARKVDNEKLVKFMKSKECLKHLWGIFDGKKNCYRHEAYQDAKERRQLLWTGIGPFQMDRDDEQIMPVITYFVSQIKSSRPQFKSSNDYVVRVWMPEAIKEALRVIKKVPEDKLDQALEEGYSETEIEKRVRKLPF